MALDFLSGLLGKTDYQATSPSYSTKPGEAAIALQLKQAAEQAQAAGYGLAAGSRGPGTALALREAQRRGIQGIQGAGNQAAIQSRQLEQEALIARGQAQMQAQQINAQIAQANSQGLSRLAGAAVVGGAMALSDDRSKRMGESDYYMPEAPTMMPQPQQSGGLLSDARAKTLEDENAALRSHLASATDVLASVGGPVYGAPAAMAHATLPPARLQHLPIPQRQDAKAQVHDEASAAEYGRQWENSRRFAMEQDLANQVAQQQAAQQAQAQLAQAQAQSAAAQSRAGVIQAGGYPMAPQEVASDERGKSAGRMDHLQFPNGVEPVAFHYKPGMGDGPDQHYGVLAQDLERSKEGATTVREDPGSGMKMVDTNRLTMLNTAKLAEFEHRLRKMGA